MNPSEHKSTLRRVLSATAAAGGTAALMLAGISGASAHVEATPDKTAANSYALLSFAIPHGCEHSGTTKMTITLPAELNDAQPTANPNWTAAKVTEQLPEPKRLADGSSITKRTSQIVYTAKAPLNPELRDVLVLSVKLPDTPGKTLYFPTLQDCEQGQSKWTDIPQEGQDEESLKSPAPSVTVTEAVAGADGHGAATDAHGAEHAGSVAGAAQAAAANDDGGQLRSWAALVAGVGGLGLGGLALARSRKPAPAGVPADGPARPE